jgi:apolipoprotein N-acyltransferase
VSSDSTTTAHPLPPADDPYADRPSFWRRNANALWAIGVFVCTVVLTVACFPPFHAPEFAYAFAAPAIFWAYLRPGFRLYAGTMFAAQAVAWTILLGWLHHVTIGVDANRASGCWRSSDWRPCGCWWSGRVPGCSAGFPGCRFP